MSNSVSEGVSGASFNMSKSFGALNKSIAKKHSDAMCVCVDKFFNAVSEFIDSLLEVLPHESQLVVIKVYIHTHMSKQKLIKKFIKKIMPVKELILRRDEDFFVRGDYIDNLFSNNVVQALFKFNFRPIWTMLNVSNRESVWMWFHALVKIADEYIKYDQLLGMTAGGRTAI